MTRSDILNSHKFQKILFFTWLTFVSINLTYAFIGYHFFHLPDKWLHSISHNIPAIQCALEKVQHYDGKHQEEVITRARQLYHVYSFTIAFGSIAGGALLLWWCIVIIHIIKTSRPIELPEKISNTPKKDLLKSIIGVLIFLVFGGYILWDQTYLGNCNVIFDSIIGRLTPNTLQYASMFWIGLLFIMLFLFLSAFIYLIHKKENKHAMY